MEIQPSSGSRPVVPASATALSASTIRRARVVALLCLLISLTTTLALAFAAGRLPGVALAPVLALAAAGTTAATIATFATFAAITTGTAATTGTAGATATQQAFGAAARARVGAPGDAWPGPLPEAAAAGTPHAWSDALTGLPNRALFLDRLNQSLAKARRTEGALAVMMLNIDRFRVVNESLGHALGDRLLKMVADRLRDMVREGDTVARFGADEFTFLLQYDSRAAEAAKVAQLALARLAEPIQLDAHRVQVTGSVGVGLYPGDGGDAEALLRSADRALARAKELGGGGYQLCTPAMNARAVARLALESDLRRALDHGELEVYYQPVVSFATGATVGMEALVRWRHPQRGLVPPGQFIPLAEELRLVLPIGDWVLSTACRQARVWQGSSLPGLRIAVNLSVLHFQDADLPRSIAGLLREIGLEPRHLDLEITESAAMQNLEQTVATLTALRRLGVRISMDDFGTGQASLNYLRRLPIDCIKIDRDFVRDIDTGGAGEAIVTAIIDMAHGLGLAVIAEGVETERQFHFLNTQGCDEYQGYLASRPVPAPEIERQLGRGALLSRPVGAGR
jgi:diguanylate cyclase (GGDEF)-like protein